MEAAPRGQEMERANEGTARGSIESLGRWNEKDDDPAMPIKMRGDVRVALVKLVDELVQNGASSGILAIRGWYISWSASPDDTSYQRHGVYESREPAGEAGATEADDEVARLKKALAAAEALKRAAEEAKRRAENATRFADFEGVTLPSGGECEWRVDGDYVYRFGGFMSVYRVTLPSGGLDPDKWAGRPPPLAPADLYTGPRSDRLLSTGEISGEYSAPCEGRECCKCDNCEICRLMTVVPLGADVIETWSTSCLFCKCPPGEPVYFLGPIVAGEVRTRDPGTNAFGGMTFSARGTASGGYKKRPGSQKRTFQKVETRDLAGTWCGCLCIPKCNWVFTTFLFCTRKKALDEDRYEESGLGCALGLPIPISGTRTRVYVNGLPTNRFDGGYDCCGKYIIHRYRDPGCAGGADFSRGHPPAGSSSFFAKKLC
ncbi:unnamed protein product [Pelagomonas calceolata]|uniref:Uncharacterized protein n=1 Tax=Pelagomonas calceolata TaxID=35677 RepID=A0A8J2WXC3_9STRA|nr:unnamed protein product [Pelagomonas calceolata]